jgi:hypothetical protein
LTGVSAVISPERVTFKFEEFVVLNVAFALEDEFSLTTLPLSLTFAPTLREVSISDVA